MVRQLLGTGLVASCALFVVACEGAPSETPRSRLDLRVATGLDDIHPVGVTIDPAGRRFMFDDQAGLFRLDPDGSVFRVRTVESLPSPGVLLVRPFTDLAAVGMDRFAVTAIGDGFLLDTAADTMTQYFCYVPDELPGDLRQRTDALTYDALEDRVYAQPATYDLADVLQYTQVAGYDRLTGDDLAWHATPTEVIAGGMVFLDGRLFLGFGTRLAPYDLTTDQLGARDDLARFGIGAIDGLAYDAAAATLLVLDGAHQELVELDRDQLAF